LFLCAALLAPAHRPCADATPESARAILTANQDALVIIEGVLKVEILSNGSRQGPERENRTSGSAFVVDPSGLVVASRFLLNPIGSMSRKPVRMDRGGESVELELRTRLENLKLRLHDGTEVPARVKLEDIELGLTLLEPDLKPGDQPRVFKAISLDEIATATPYSQYLILDQGEASFRNEAILAVGTISGILDKPQPLFLQDLGRPWHFVSAPFFDLSGKLLGMGLLHSAPPKDPMSRTADGQSFPAILPAAQIRDFVNKALKKETPVKPPHPSSADRFPELSTEQAGALVQAASPSVVVVEGTVRYKCGRCTEEHEDEIEAVGTLLDANGLLVIGSDDDSAENKYLEQHLRCVLADGSEAPYEILLHDDDLGLTVLAPVLKDGAKPPALKVLSLAGDLPAKLLDDVVAVGRLGKDFRYAASASIGKITGVAHQPRTYYQLYNVPPSVAQEGVPVIGTAGTVLGIVASDPQESHGDDSDSDRGGRNVQQRATRTRVVPAAAVGDLLEHARKAQAKNSAELKPSGN
jgi:hypothetical protein